MKTALIFLGIALIIIISFLLARKRVLTCPECKSNNCRKTGERKVIERKRRALIAGPFPYYNYVYKCPKCGHKFWSAVENMLGQ